MNPTGAPEPFWDFCEVMKGLFILALYESSGWVKDCEPLLGVTEREPMHQA